MRSAAAFVGVLLAIHEMCPLRIASCRIWVTLSVQVKTSVFFDDVCDYENGLYWKQVYVTSLCPWNSSAWQLDCAALVSSLGYADGVGDDDGRAADRGAVHLFYVAYRACAHLHGAADKSNFPCRHLPCYL